MRVSVYTVSSNNIIIHTSINMQAHKKPLKASNTNKNERKHILKLVKIKENQ